MLYSQAVYGIPALIVLDTQNLFKNLTSSTFKPDWTLANRQVIDEDTIMVLDPDTGDVLSSYGKDMFYMPHGLTIDGEGNTYVTDTGLHQVMRVSGDVDQCSFLRQVDGSSCVSLIITWLVHSLQNR